MSQCNDIAFLQSLCTIEDNSYPSVAMLTTLNHPRPTGPLDFDLSARRARNDRKLKSIFEHIFDKYEKDFTNVGDEIDLSTGNIVVNNGHLQSLDVEGDPGDLSDTDILNSDEIDKNGSNEVSPQKNRNSLKGTSDLHTDAGFVINAVERRITYTSIGRRQSASAETNRADSLVEGPLSSTCGSKNVGYRPNSDDRLIEPRWRTPRLPMDDMRIQEAPWTNSSDIQKDTVIPPSPPNQSIWATPTFGPRRILKRKAESAGFPFTRPKRRKAAMWTPEQGATPTIRAGRSTDMSETRVQVHAPDHRRSMQRQGYSSQPRSQARPRSPCSDSVEKYRVWTSKENELLIALKVESLQGRKLYTHAFPGRQYGSIHSHWRWLRYNYPQKIQDRRQYSIPEHLKALNSNRGSPKYKSPQVKAEIAARKSLPSRLDQVYQVPEEIREPSESLAPALNENSEVPLAGWAANVEKPRIIVGDQDQRHTIGAELRRAVIPDSQEDEDLELLGLTRSRDSEGESTSVTVAKEQPGVIANTASVTPGLTSAIGQGREVIDLIVESDDSDDEALVYAANGNRVVGTTCDQNGSHIIDYRLLDDLTPEPLGSSRSLAGSQGEHAVSSSVNSRRRDDIPSIHPPLPIVQAAIPNSSTDAELTPPCSNNVDSVSKRISPPSGHPNTLIINERDRCTRPSRLRRQTDNANVSTKEKSPKKSATPEPQETPMKISLAPKKTWKKPKQKPFAKRKSDSAVAGMHATDLDSEDELAGTAAEMRATHGSTIKATKSRSWRRTLMERRKSTG